MIKKIIISIALFFVSSSLVTAQTAGFETMEAKVVWIVAENQTYQKLKLEITSGEETGKTIEFENGLYPTSYVQLYVIGDRVILGKNSIEGREAEYYIVDQVRRPGLYTLMALFIGITILVARRRAIQSIIALGVSFAVIFKIILPQILNGGDPILTSLIAAIIIIPVTFYLSHGLNRKTHIAIIATIISLAITAILATVFINVTKLTGFASEEATFLQADKGQLINIRGLLLAGIIIGVLGILDDVTVSQAGLVEELYLANTKLSAKKLYKKAMNVGTDHIASMINTLVLVYTGAAMPLLLLFLDSPKPFTEIINYEIVAEEIVRMLVGSIGLVLAVPLTTILSVAYIGRRQQT